MKENWWDEHLADPVNFDNFERQLGGVDWHSRVWVRDFLREQFGLKRFSLCDMGCGLGTELEGYRREKIDVDYLGVDGSKLLLTKAKERFPGDKFMKADLADTFLNDKQFDVALVRHIFEHQEDYIPILDEAMRIAKMVIVVFFRLTKAREDTKQIIVSDGVEVYDNSLSERKFDQTLLGYCCAFKAYKVGPNETVYVIEVK